MPGKEAMIAAIHTHVRAENAKDRETWLGNYADDVVFEDPVGVMTIHGRAELGGAFWDRIAGAEIELSLEHEPIVCGNELVAILCAKVAMEGFERTLRPIVLLDTFNAAGKIVHLRSFFAHGEPDPSRTLDPQTMIAAVKTHCRAESEGDKAAWVRIFADDVVIEDPVGAGAIYRGIEAASTTFWDQAQRAGARLELLEDVIVCGNEAVAIIKAEVGPADNRRTLSPIVDHFTFDEAGKIAGMRAFFAY